MQRMSGWVASPTHTHGHEELVMDTEAWHAAIHGIAKRIKLG